jgi:branched-chain amino acid transport system substrate-binding protein
MKRGLLCSALAALALAACSQGQNTIRIGYVGPLTGDASSYGSDTLNGVRIAIDEVNAKGGIGGKKIELIAEDGRCNGADASNAAQKLVNVDQVVAIIGGQCSSETLAIAPIVEAAKILLISPVSSNPAITDAGDYVFRVTPSDALKGKAIDAYIQKAGFKKVAIISENTDFCQGVREAVTGNLPSGVTAVFDEVVDAGTKDYRTLMTRLKAMNFDVFIPNAQSDAVVAEMAKQMRELGMTQQMIGADGADSVNLGKIAPEAVEGMKVLSLPALDESVPAAKEFGTIFRQRYDEPKQSLYWSALAYDAANVVLKGLDAGEPAGLKDYLYNMKDYNGLSGVFHFDKNGDVVGLPFGLKEFKNGDLQQSEVVPVK